jgi:hypothetical protein
MARNINEIITNLPVKRRRKIEKRSRPAYQFSPRAQT